MSTGDERKSYDQQLIELCRSESRFLMAFTTVSVYRQHKRERRAVRMARKRRRGWA